VAVINEAITIPEEATPIISALKLSDQIRSLRRSKNQRFSLRIGKLIRGRLAKVSRRSGVSLRRGEKNTKRRDAQGPTERNTTGFAVRSRSGRDRHGDLANYLMSVREIGRWF
jgi:hypothetical protein